MYWLKRRLRVDIRELFIAFVLGIVEGLTEFIPVSSTGHMIIIDDLLLQSYIVLGSTELANTFKVVIQFGSILAVIIIFWERFLKLIPQQENAIVELQKSDVKKVTYQ